MSAEEHDPLRRLRGEVASLLHDLDAVAASDDVSLAQAGRYIAILTEHIAGLRDAVQVAEFVENAEAVIGELVASKARA